LLDSILYFLELEVADIELGLLCSYFFTLPISSLGHPLQLSLAILGLLLSLMHFLL
jgi:hypothetical protein